MIEAAPDNESGGRLDSRFRSLVTLREVSDRAELEAANAKREYKQYEADLWEQLEDEGHKTIIVDLGPGYGTVQFQRRETVYGRVLDLDTLLDSLEQSGRIDELTKPGIEKKRLNELVRECLENGQELPEGSDFYSRRYVSISKKG